MHCFKANKKYIHVVEFLVEQYPDATLLTFRYDASNEAFTYLLFATYDEARQQSVIV